MWRLRTAGSIGTDSVSRTDAAQLACKAFLETLTERRIDGGGQAWLAPRLAAETVGHPTSVLSQWRGKTGCPAIGERLKTKPFPDVIGRSVRYYKEEQLDRLIDADAATRPGRSKQWLTFDEAKKKKGYPSEMTIYSLIEAGTLSTESAPGIDRNGRRSRERVLLSKADLENWQAKRAGQKLPPGELTIAEAAEERGLTVDEMRGLVRRHPSLVRNRNGSALYKRMMRKGIILDRAKVADFFARRLARSDNSKEPMSMAKAIGDPSKSNCGKAPAAPGQKQRGRPVGTTDHKAELRNEKMIKAWKSGGFKSRAKLAAAFKVSRTHASKTLKAAEIAD